MRMRKDRKKVTLQPLIRKNQMPRPALFEIEREGGTIIVTPVVNLGELEDMDLNAEEVVEVLSDLSIKNLVMDFHKTDYFGSTALGLFVKLWKMVTARNGCMAFCNPSEHELEILHVTRLNTLWPICKSREQAMKVVGN
jgi:anti-anti-sigma factor